MSGQAQPRRKCLSALQCRPSALASLRSLHPQVARPRKPPPLLKTFQCCIVACAPNLRCFARLSLVAKLHDPACMQSSVSHCQTLLKPGSFLSCWWGRKWHKIARITKERTSQGIFCFLQAVLLPFFQISTVFSISVFLNMFARRRTISRVRKHIEACITCMTQFDFYQLVFCVL